MKRLWIGITFLSVLLAGGIWQSFGIAGIHQELSRSLSQAADAARQQNWAKADALSEAAEEKWDRCRNLTAAFADHEPLEELEKLFAELQLCRQLSLEDNYAVVCSDLSQICKAIAESFQISWWNVL